jgi:hypothetical protein
MPKPVLNDVEWNCLLLGFNGKSVAQRLWLA